MRTALIVKKSTKQLSENKIDKQFLPKTLQEK